MQAAKCGQSLEEQLCPVTKESIEAYLEYEKGKGVSAQGLQRYRHFTASLYGWLPEEKILTQKKLLQWRQYLKDMGYAPETEQSYIKGINRYLDFMGYSQLRFNRGRSAELTGQQFGYLTVLERTGTKIRNNNLWRCRCRCGEVVELTATRLLTGNTLSCGCLREEHLKAANKYCDGTSIRQSVEDKISSDRAESGYTGVTKKREKWQAYVKFKGKQYSLGCYSDLEEAVKARSRGKERVQQAAIELLAQYEALHKDDPALPDRAQLREMKKQEQEAVAAIPERTPVLRSNNTSGYPGITRKRNKWSAKITYQKVTYQLGCYEKIEEAIAVRRAAEEQLAASPETFSRWMEQRTAGK